MLMLRLTINYQRLITPGIILLSLAVLAASQVTVLRQLESKNDKIRSPAEYLREVEQTKIRLDFLQRLPNLGFNNLIADWAFLQFLQYFGDWRARAVTGYGLAPQFFEVVVDRDPRFVQTYSFLSVSVSLYAGQPLKSVRLIDQGLKSLTPEMPDAFYVWVYKSTDELLFLGDTQAALRSNAKATEWAEIQNTPDSLRIAALSRQTAAFLRQNPISKRAQVSAWMMILANATDDRTRELVLEQIQRLGGRLDRLENGAYRILLPDID
uniref:Uncharacterized protein n=1 Tax=Cyanothece sp. (strain PCC 7425 / ATCC 29141) TaxID=395961 RepID=B8HX18_CYAP4